MLVSVVIPVKDDDRLFKCLDALAGAPSGDADVEIIVVDNDSAPSFRDSLNDLDSRIRVLDEPRPGAFAARNRGVDFASGAVIMFTDADCVPAPRWVAHALSGLEETGADIVQGFSGTTAATRTVGDLIQGRYRLAYRNLRFGQPVDCDTRNMAVRKEVLERLRFNADFRRVGDTEFGLVAESLGFRVAYAPSMRVDHEHDDQLDTFVAKQVCHGWGAQRLMNDHPEVHWRSRSLRLLARGANSMGRIRGRRVVGKELARFAIVGARGLQKCESNAPAVAVGAALLCLDKLGLLSGHLLYEPGGREPAPSDYLGRRLPRE